MRINDDLSVPVTVHVSELTWVPSPSPGVERKMLYRVGGEVARATSIVRYAPGSAFPRRTHGGGEEILVLEGTFQDEHGDYPAGSYFRNPPGTSHVPASEAGCTILVRLWQYRQGDDVQVVRRPGEGTAIAPHAGALDARELFDDEREQVRIERCAPDAAIAIPNQRGLELFVIEGSATTATESLDRQTWVRLPEGQVFRAAAGPEGMTLWLKDAPLEHPDVQVIPA